MTFYDCANGNVCIEKLVEGIIYCFVAHNLHVHRFTRTTFLSLWKPLITYYQVYIRSRRGYFRGPIFLLPSDTIEEVY